MRTSLDLKHFNVFIYSQVSVLIILSLLVLSGQAKAEKLTSELAREREARISAETAMNRSNRERDELQNALKEAVHAADLLRQDKIYLEREIASLSDQNRKMEAEVIFL